jgi:hypothetical protein
MSADAIRLAAPQATRQVVRGRVDGADRNPCASLSQWPSQIAVIRDHYRRIDRAFEGIDQEV